MVFGVWQQVFAFGVKMGFLRKRKREKVGTSSYNYDEEEIKSSTQESLDLNGDDIEAGKMWDAINDFLFLILKIVILGFLAYIFCSSMLGGYMPQVFNVP